MNILATTTSVSAGATAATASLLAAATLSLDWNTIIMGVIGLVTTAITTIVGYMVMRLRDDAKDTKVAAKTTSEEVSKVHAAVNSERTAMQGELRALRDEILRLSTAGAVLATQVNTGRQLEEMKEKVTPTISPSASATASGSSENESDLCG